MNSVLSAHRKQIIPGDVLLITVSDMVFSDDENLQQNLESFAEDADVYVLVMQESHFKDLKKLSLTDLITLQERIEEAIQEISERDSLAQA